MMDEWRVVLLRDPCAYCGGEAEAVDHIEPRSAGGKNVSENTIAACKPCNSSKGAKSLLHFLLARRHGVVIRNPQRAHAAAVRFAPSMVEWLTGRARYNESSVAAEVRRIVRRAMDGELAEAE